MSHSADSEIRNLLALYCHHLDAGNADMLADLFATDAHLQVMSKVIEGRDAIRGWFEEMADAPALSIHHTTNTVLRIEGDRATADSNWITSRLGPSSRVWKIFAVGTYSDEFALTAEGWLFARRVDSVLGDFSFEETIRAYLAED